MGILFSPEVAELKKQLDEIMVFVPMYGDSFFTSWNLRDLVAEMD